MQTRRNFLYSSALAAAVLLHGRLSAEQKKASQETLPVVGDSPEDAGPLAHDLSSRLQRRDISKAMKKVGIWELERTEHDFNDNWTLAALYTGFMAAARTLPEKRFEQAMLAMGEQLQWKPGPDPLHADHQAVGQTYLELYFKYRRPEMLAPIQQRFDAMMQHKDDPKKPLWWWCDALFMAPPVCTRLFHATGDEAYLHFLDREWDASSAALYDEQEHLFFRDQRYLNQRESNGKKLFWSRGNGWVMAGLVRVLEYLPSNWPTRERYITQLQQMAASVAAVQSEDGLWRSGLLDAQAYALPEVSGSGFIAYAMAWGVRHGQLDQPTYLPAVQRAWEGMMGHVYADGRLGCIQPVGAAPGQFKPTSSYVYGVGAFLLAGSELLQLHHSTRTI